MTLRLFNPEHDIALAANLSNFTAPHAARQLRRDLGFLPVLWANQGDAVLVDDVVSSYKSLQKTAVALKRYCGVSLPDIGDMLIDKLGDKTPTTVSPWGWDKALKAQLIRNGVKEDILPTDNQLDIVRTLSHRRTSSVVLAHLQMEGTVGESHECTTVAGVEAYVKTCNMTVLKAPWSSSGRGLRFVARQEEGRLLPSVAGWVRNIISTQGCVMVEPYYNKVKDFGMEFVAHGDGHVSYEGLSLFHTANGAYKGNILATESWKLASLGAFVPTEFICKIKDWLCRELERCLAGRYTGPLGVDMMVVADAGRECYLLHPCVEINLRRTMGHVALAISPTDDDIQSVMRIALIDNIYKLTISRL